MGKGKVKIEIGKIGESGGREEKVEMEKGKGRGEVKGKNVGKGKEREGEERIER